MKFGLKRWDGACLIFIFVLCMLRITLFIFAFCTVCSPICIFELVRELRGCTYREGRKARASLLIYTVPSFRAH